MKLHQKIFGIGLVTAVIVPHLCEKCYIKLLIHYLKFHDIPIPGAFIP